MASDGYDSDHGWAVEVVLVDKRVGWVVPAVATVVATLAVLSVSPVIALGALALVVLLLIPSSWLPGIAIAAWYGFGFPELAGAVVGPVTVYEIVLLVWLMRESPRILNARTRIDSSDWFLALFLISLISMTVLAAGPSTAVLRLVLYALCGVALERGARINMKVLLVGATFVIVQSVMMSFTGLGDRLYGYDPAQLGFLAIAVWVFFDYRKSRVVRTAVQFLLVVVILATQTRSVWFAFFLVVCLRLAPRISRTGLVAAIFVPLIAGVLIVDSFTELLNLNANSAALRVASLKAGLEVALSNPWFGVGWANADINSTIKDEGFYTQNFGVYNVFLGLLVAGGAVTLLAFLAFLGKRLDAVRKNNKQALLVMVAVVAMGMSEMIIYPGSVITFFFFLCAGMGQPPDQTGTQRVGDGSTQGDAVLTDASAGRRFGAPLP